MEEFRARILRLVTRHPTLSKALREHLPPVREEKVFGIRFDDVSNPVFDDAMTPEEIAKLYRLNSLPLAGERGYILVAADGPLNWSVRFGGAA